MGKQLTTFLAPGQGGLATLVAVCGGKPLWDTYHTMFDKVIKGSFHAPMALAATRAQLVTFDSL